MSTEYHGKIQLASKGFFYQGELAEKEGWLDVEPWGTPEERIMASPSLTFTETIDRLVKKCTNCPIDPGELLLVDRWQLFIYMRCLSYGGAYSFPYKCDQCGSKELHQMNLEKDLEVRYADDPDLLRELGKERNERLTEPFSFILPIQGKTILWRMLRGKDEVAIAKHISRQKNRRTSSSGDDSAFEYRQALRIVGIDDNKEPSISDCMDLIDSLKGKDTLEWREQTRAVAIGVEDTLFPKCTKCGWESEVAVPVDKSFFRPERTTAKSA